MPEPVVERTPSKSESARDQKSVTHYLSKSTGRNYWAVLDPMDFATFPRFEALPYLKEARLIQRAQAGDIDARNIIWTQHARLALAVINRFKIPTHLLADAIQEGVLGLERAIEKYEVDRYNAFSTYAWYWVYQKIQRFLDYHRHFVRIPPHIRPLVYKSLRGSHLEFETTQQENVVQSVIKVFAPISLVSLEPDEHPWYSNERSLDDLDADLFITELRRVLPRREFFIVKHRFGLAGARTKTLEAISKKLGVTRERVRQIEMRAIDRLRRTLPVSYCHLVIPQPDQENSNVQSEDSISQRIQDEGRAKQEGLEVPQERLSAAGLEILLHDILAKFTFRQANALIYFYGLLNTPPLTLMEVAELLELTPRKARLALRKGRRKLLNFLHPIPSEQVRVIREQIAADTSFECVDSLEDV